jgi:hypothetical protein
MTTLNGDYMKSTKRVSIPHLWCPGNSMEMKQKDFDVFVKKLTKNWDGRLHNTNCEISEKIDGAGIRFGINNQRFFIESSRSGPIYDKRAFSKYTAEKKGAPDKMSLGYDDMFNLLKSNKELQGNLEYLKMNIKFIGEVLYNDFGEYSEDGTKIKFVNTWYNVNALGKKATFVLFDLIDENGVQLPYKDSIMKMITRVSSNENILFTTPKLECTFHLDLSKDLTREGIHKKILQSFDRSKFGNEYEGFVVKTCDTTFKVVTETFTNAKRKLK